MPLDSEFCHHLHELKVETSEKLSDELNQHKRTRIWEAQKTGNAAALPLAYKEASIHSFRTRVTATIASYLNALESFGITVDDAVEQEMLTKIASLTNARPSLSLPPGLNPPNISSIHTAHKLELSRTAHAMYREAANRLRELKVKARMSARPTKKEGNPTRHTADVLNVLIASPSDVSEERDVVEAAIHDWNAAHFSSTGIILNPVRWESHAYPASGDRPQAIINRQIVESGDILVAIFGYKLGTPTGEAQSGTIEEIEEFRKAGKYVALYFSTANVPRSADRLQLEALEAYKRDRRADTLYFEFEDSSGLRDHLIRHLPKIVREVHEGLGFSNPTRGTSPDIAPPSNTGSDSDKGTGHLTALADIVSELEDNLSSARAPRVGDTYKRPSSRVWKELRNRVSIPEDLRNRVAGAYRQIEEWHDIVISGLSPNIGSTALELKVNDLRHQLPELVKELKKVESLGRLPKLSTDAQNLLLAASGDRDGSILFVEVNEGLIIQVGQQQFAETGNRRSEARWRAAVNELLQLELIKRPSPDSDVIGVTHAGYEYTDKLRSFNAASLA